ncbi:MAG: hypothetical protein UW86_C0009G0008 [Microgenomates group bacterium GW2011_GWA1_Microgenomates_45_10]|nr:MAG: hypothetical protein UW73_C0022G0008 [Microgenomates group bacterium GW2011_GWB1_44_8]KKT87105.1 MAG: hypothetical protein UW86_C0009G0008 [Microgenomates group bacterium GW2011_GWA1_Microgenomates_45_10]
MQKIGQVLKGINLNRDKYVSREFQLYGYKLAEELGDLEHKSIYIRFAKTIPRAILEQAKNFVKDTKNVKNPAKYFMWKLKELRQLSKISKRS